MAERGNLHVLIAGGSRNYILSIKASLEQTGFFGKYSIAYSGKEALEKIQQSKPDLVVMDIILRETDGLSLLEEIRSQPDTEDCRVIVHTSATSDVLIRKVLESGADYYLPKPTAYVAFRRTVEEVLQINGNPRTILVGSIDARIMGVIQRIGFPIGSMGYQYAQYAIKRLVQDASLKDQITAKLYMEIAQKFETRVGRVERNIRHSIEVAWTRGDLEYIQQLFGYTVDEEKGKPTNTAFLVTVADYVRASMYSAK